MGRGRICYVLILTSGGLWGSGQGGVEADFSPVLCTHSSGVEIPCIPNTYIKGLLRRSLEDVIEHLHRVGIVDSICIVEELFGPLTVVSGKTKVVPSDIVIAPLYPVKDFSAAEVFSKLEPLSYLNPDIISSKSGLLEPRLYVEPHIRIDDRSGTTSVGSLYKELRIIPDTIFYGEIVIYSENESKAVSILRTLAIAIGFLKTRCVGRKTYAKPRILSVTYNGKNVEDFIVKKIIEFLQF